MRAPPVARLYLWLMLLATGGLLVWWAWAWRGPALGNPGLLALLLALGVAAQHFPLPLGPHHKVSVASAAYFAALLLVGPPVAMALVIVSQLLGGGSLALRRDPASGRRRRAPADVLFNAAQLALATGLAGLVYYTAVPHQAPAALGSPADLWAIPAAAMVFHLANSWAVAVMVGLYRGRSPIAVWRVGRGTAALEEVVLVTLGLIMALLVGRYPWAPLLLVAPVALLHWSLRRMTELLAETARREREAVLLAEAGRRFGASPARDEVLAGVVALATQGFGDAAVVELADAAGAAPALHAAAFANDVVEARWRARPVGFPPGAPAALRQPDSSLLIPDAEADPRLDRAAVAAVGLRSWLGVPLRGRESLLGTLGIASVAGGEARRFDAGDLRLAEGLAGRAAAALENAALHERLAASAADLGAVLDGIEQGVLMADRRGRIRYANRRLGELLGLDAGALRGRLLRAVAEEELAGRVGDQRAFLARVSWLDAHPGEVATDEVALARPVARVLSRYSGPVRLAGAGTPIGRLEVYTDVTEARRLERAKDEFMATASHEFKTPLTTLGGHLELLERQLTRPQGPDTARLAHHARSARGELARLRRLTEDLLEVARIGTGRLTLRPAPGDLAATVRETVARFVARPGLRERGHHLVCRADAPLPAYFDRVRLEQVLGNLLENALKYAPGGGDVVVEARRVGDEAVVGVRDRGIGVPAAEREKLFEPFYRADNATAGSPEGLGLGLHISRGIVEGHGGRLWVEPAPGGERGSLFRFALPLHERATTIPPAGRSARPPPAATQHEHADARD